jgi:hypothetical protein
MISYISNQSYNSALFTLKKNFYPGIDSILSEAKRISSYRLLRNCNRENYLNQIPIEKAKSLISSIIEDDNASLNFDYLQELETKESIQAKLINSNPATQATPEDLTPFLIKPSRIFSGSSHSNKILELIKTETNNEEKINFTYNFYVNNFESLLLYSKPYDLGIHEDGTQIYSNFNSNFLKLDFKKLPPSSNNYSPNIGSNNSGLFIKNCLDYQSVQKFISGDLNSESKSPPIYHKGPSIASARSCFKYSNDLNLTTSTNFLNEPFNETKENFTVLHLPSWGSKTLKDPIWVNVKASFIKRRKGVFVPALSKAQVLNEDKTLTQVYFLTLSLINDKTLDKDFCEILQDHQNPANSFYNFIEKYLFEESLYFLSYEKYKKKITQTYGSSNPFLSLNISNPQILSYCKNHSRIKDNFASFSSENVFNSKTNFYISSKPKEDLNLLKRIEKANFKFTKYAANFINFKIQLKATFELIQAAKYIHSLQLKFKINERKLAEVENICSRLQSFSKHYSKLKTTQQAALTTNIKNGIYETDLFFQNLKDNSIFITSIVYENGKTLTNASLENFTNLSLSTLKIVEVVFLIDKPVAIYVDSKQNPKAIKVGGPYIVTVSRNSVSLRLKDKHSLFCFTSPRGSSYKYHPHVSATTRLDSAASACLGEAAPLIFNAFSKNCLKTIIMSAMTWVTSANSTDVWGRTYVDFLDYSFISTNKNVISQEDSDSTEITQEEVTSFLDALDENLSSIDDSVTPQELNPILTSNTQPTYTPYSQRLTVS